MSMSLGWGIALGFLVAGSVMGIIAQVLDWKDRLSGHKRQETKP